jgi:hypothetical protein
MLYNQPYGVSDPNAAYINGNPATGIAGSIPPAASIEFPQREIVNLINFATLAPSNSDLNQLAKAVQTQRVNWALDTGTADALAIALAPIPTSYVNGMPFRLIKAGADNATTTPTVNINGLGPKTMVHFDGTPLSAAELKANSLVSGVYDGTAFRLTTPASGGGTGSQSWYGLDVGTADAMVVTIAGLTAYVTGHRYWITKAAFANTISNPTININGFGAKTVTRFDSTALEGAELPAGCMMTLEYDGTKCRILSADRPSTKTEAEAGVSANTFISPLTLFQRRVPFFSAQGTVAQGIPPGVDTKVNNLSTLVGTLLNTGSSFTASAFTCGPKDSGVWMFMAYTAMVLLSNSSAGKDYRGAIAQNGITGPFMSNYVNESSTYGLVVTTPMIVNSGDVITSSVFQSTDTTRNIGATQFVGWRINGAV